LQHFGEFRLDECRDSGRVGSLPGFAHVSLEPRIFRFGQVTLKLVEAHLSRRILALKAGVGRVQAAVLDLRGLVLVPLAHLAHVFLAAQRGNLVDVLALLVGVYGFGGLLGQLFDGGLVALLLRFLIHAFEFQPALTFFFVAAVSLGLVRAKLWQLRQVHLRGFGRLAAGLRLRTVYRRLGGGCRFRVGRGRFGVIQTLHRGERGQFRGVVVNYLLKFGRHGGKFLSGREIKKDARPDAIAFGSGA